MSIVRKVADFGQPTADPVSASTSSMERSISCISRMTLSTLKVPMRLAMKFGVSFAKTMPLPRRTSQKCAMDSIAAAIGLRGGNDLQQAHVARRIEEVRAEPVAAEIVGKAFSDGRHRQSAGVGGDDRSGLANGFYFAQQLALDFEVLDDGLDDPVAFGEPLQVVVEVADGDQLGEVRFKECRRLGLARGVKPGGGEFVARGSVGIGRHDVEQVRRNSGVGQVCGDAGTHGSRAKDCDFLDPLIHSETFSKRSFQRFCSRGMFESYESAGKGPTDKTSYFDWDATHDRYDS